MDAEKWREGGASLHTLPYLVVCTGMWYCACCLGNRGFVCMREVVEVRGRALVMWRRGERVASFVSFVGFCFVLVRVDVVLLEGLWE